MYFIDIKRGFLFISAIHFNVFCQDIAVSKEQPVKQEANITIFIHGTYPAGIRSLFKNYMCVSNEPTLVSNINTKYPTLKSRYHYIRFIGKHLSRTDCQQFPIEHFYAIGWSGQLSSQARIDGAKVLYKGIKQLDEDYKGRNLIPKITLITHSHGGNVALNLAKVKDSDDKDFKINRLMLLGTPIQEETKNLSADPIFEKIYNIYSGLDAIQILDPQGLHEVNKNNKECPMFSKRRLPCKDNIRQAQVKINNAGLAHEDMLMPFFFKLLPKLLKEMDNLPDTTSHYLIKAFSYHKRGWQLINMEKRSRFTKFGRKKRKIIQIS